MMFGKMILDGDSRILTFPKFSRLWRNEEFASNFLAHVSLVVIDWEGKGKGVLDVSRGDCYFDQSVEEWLVFNVVAMGVIWHW